jgi:ankyrin repeat protein
MDVEAKTLELGKLMASRSRYIGHKPWLPFEGDIDYSLYTPELVKKIAILLETGADPHLVVCAYLIGGRFYHRLLGSISTGDFFERSYAEACPPNVRNKHRTLESYLTHIVTPLFDAAENRDSKAISFYSKLGVGISSTASNLVMSGINVRDLRNPFASALAYRQLEIVEQLLGLTEPGDDSVESWLCDALLTALWPALGEPPNLHLVKLLQTRGIDLSYASISPGQASNRAIDLILQCAEAHVGRAHEDSIPVTIPFIDGVNICTFLTGTQSTEWTRGPYGITALMLAVSCASTAMCRILLSCGADPNETDDFGMTALADAIYFGHGEAVDLLLTHNANPNHLISGSHTQSIATEVEPWLWQRNAAARLYQKKKWNILHIAAHLNCMRAIVALCNARADTRSFDSDGCSPMDIAMKNSHEKAASYLLNHQRAPVQGHSVIPPVFTLATEHCKDDVSSDLAVSIQRVSMTSRYEKLQTKFEELLKTNKRSTSKRKFRGHDTKAAEPYQRCLCVDCSLALETGTFGYISYPGRHGSGCNLCQLLLDCHFAGANGLMSLEYNKSANGKDNELTMTSSRGLSFHHPLLKVTGKFILITSCEITYQICQFP